MQSYSHVTFPEPAQSAVYPSFLIQKVDPGLWSDILDRFEDANIFQTPAFHNAKPAGELLEHWVIRRRSETIAAAQVRIIPVPLIRKSIAYVLWGPLIHLNGSERDWQALRASLCLLREQYVQRRRMCLRVKPPTMLDGDSDWQHALRSEGYAHSTHTRAGRTILLNIARPLEELRASLDKKWRNCLKSAECNGLTIEEGSDDAMFDVFLAMYREMLSRKHLVEPGDIRRFRAMQPILPANQRMHVFFARDQDGSPSAGAICSAIGTRGIFLFGATADNGMKNRASYLVQWRVLQWLKQVGCTEYDLHGSSAEANPGVYAFKMGLCGKNGREVNALGSYEAYPGAFDRPLLQAMDRANAALKHAKRIVDKHRGFPG